uniref:Laminin G domain-containing protein n=1 Tax=Hucho hucho TaxID=62062 RepID=A0A4W5M9G0_9TELE
MTSYRMIFKSAVSQPLYTASFYGDGYVQLRTVELSSRTSLHVRFRTSRHSGLLFLAAGETDFLLLELHSGRLQVQLDLGSGERTLRSEKGVHLNDLAWHSVELQHDQHNVTLTVDRHSHTSVRIPGPDLDLSVHHGLFVGGTVGLDKPYLHSFRGCVDEVLFNQHNLLSSLRPYSGYKSVHEVSLGCNSQFSAGEDDPISFFSSRAYMSLPTWDVPQEGVLECEVHTSSEEGIVLYSSAQQRDFIAMEIQEGSLVVVVGNGGTRTELHSLTYVNNQKWHRVKLHLLPHSEEIVNHSLGAHSKSLQLRGPLYMGGVDDRSRLEARKAGLLSFNGKRLAGGGSFKGCLRDIRVNAQRMGLPHAVVTKDISVGCELEKLPEAITTVSPTAVLSVTLPLVHHHGSERNRKKPGQNFLVLKDLVVPEGGRALLESKHMKVNLEFRKLGIRQSQIMFRIEEQPVHGQLRLDVDHSDQDEDWSFSMLDLWHGRVIYVHGGSEDPQDFFMFSVFTNSKKEIPFYLKGNKLHRFNISVTPVNDAPELSLPEGSLFILLENSKRHLNTDVLRATDLDSNSTDLVFTVLGNHNAEAGLLENQDHPGTAITTFSQPDLEEGKVSYVHTGGLVRNSRMAVRVSDGDKVSNTVVLRIMAVQLEHKVANNTGVEVDQGGAAVISSQHLAMQVNVVKQGFDIRYDVVEAPRYGELQRLHSSGEWKPTFVFSQKLLEKERIRYLAVLFDLCLCAIVHCFNTTTATDELVFNITVRWIHFKVTRSKMEVSGVRKVLSNEELRVVSKGIKLHDNELHFRMLSVPKKGQLVFKDKVLMKNSTFSQKNISDHMVKYEVTGRPHEDTRDSFSFQVVSKHAHSGGYDFRINIKADVHSLILTNKGLSILEGESKVITKDLLFSETVGVKAALYTLTSSPKHGKLKRINLSNSTSINDNITAFTNQDIIEDRIMYVHDGSETTEDAFTFHTTVAKHTKAHNHKRTHSKKENTHTIDDIFNISIALVNDEKPVRVVDKVFHVARGRQRLLTLDDLCYHDADSDFDDSQLIYTRRGIPMGDLVLVNDTGHKLYQFSQEDLQQRRVLFIHRGVSFGRFVLFVSDGKHYTSTLLEVIAQDPYIQVENSTGLLVQKGHAAILGSANFSVFTNQDVRDNEEVVYQVFLPPRHGHLFHNNVKVDRFTQHDLKVGSVQYRHDDSMNLADSFNFTVSVKEVRLDASVGVRVYLESHQQPPTVLYNHIVVVEEGKSVKINRGDLEVRYYIEVPYHKHKNHGLSSQVLVIRDTRTDPITLTGVLHKFYVAVQYDGRILIEFPCLTEMFSILNLFLSACFLVLFSTCNCPLLYLSPLQVWVNSVTEISVDDLSAEDSDSPPEDLEFIVTPPSNGHLALKSAPSRHILNFTQTHTLHGQLVFVHSGSFSYRIEGSVNTISQNNLLVVTNDNDDMGGNHSILYNVTSPPKLGRLLRKQTDNSTAEISSFTQDMVGLCVMFNKSFLFMFVCCSSLLPGAVVTEGGRVVIGKIQLDSSNLLGKLLEPQRRSYEVWYHVTSLPQHGIITVGERNLTSAKPNFSQFILDKFGITYQHDDSETTQDFFTFEIWLNRKGQLPQRPSEPSLIVTESFDLTVTPVNDQPPLLRTKAPSLRLVQGDTVVISPENLLVEDLDTPPEEIHYKVFFMSSFTVLHLYRTVSAFSQADINHGRVHFIQNGEPSSGVFYFSVTDGFHRPLYKIFNLEVTAATVSIVNNTGLRLVQGQTTATLTTEHLAAETNGRHSVTIHYRVTTPPHHGSLLMSDLPVSEFNQEDLHSCRLSYHMTDLTSSSDSFEFTVSTPESNMTAQTVNVTVRPLIHFSERVLIPSGIAVKLRKDYLDATDLATLSGSDPVFHILSPPKHGKLVKVTFDLSDGANHSVESFTFRDVVQGRVALQETLAQQRHKIHVSMLNDSFSFLLRADNVQPAVGEFLFTIVPYKESLNHTTRSPGRNRTTGGRGTTIHSATHPHTTNQTHNKTLQKQFKGRHHWGNQTRGGHPMIPTISGNTHGKHNVHGPHRITPVRVESLPRPASDPLLLILPFLACLLLIVILVVLILVLRHRREKRALSRGLIQELAAAAGDGGPEVSPYLGRPERSIAVPSVVVTPLLDPNSCPSTPVLNLLRRGTLAPRDPCLLLWAVDAVPDMVQAQQCQPPEPTLRDNQYWV